MAWAGGGTRGSWLYFSGKRKQGGRGDLKKKNAPTKKGGDLCRPHGKDIFINQNKKGGSQKEERKTQGAQQDPKGVAPTESSTSQEFIAKGKQPRIEQPPHRKKAQHRGGGPGKG